MVLWYQEKETVCDNKVFVDFKVCPFKEPSDGKFDLKIDSSSHVSWFRHKKDELLKALGLPTERQNRGISCKSKKVCDSKILHHVLFVLLHLG